MDPKLNERFVMRVSVAIVAALALVSVSASAEEKKAEGKDPNRIVCQKQEVLGSRVATKRVCMTAAEWDAKRLEDRQNLDRNQTQRSGVSGQ